MKEKSTQVSERVLSKRVDVKPKNSIQVSPAESRDMNRSCQLLNFYDGWVINGRESKKLCYISYHCKFILCLEFNKILYIGQNCVKARYLAFPGRGRSFLCLYVSPHHRRGRQVQAEIWHNSILSLTSSRRSVSQLIFIQVNCWGQNHARSKQWNKYFNKSTTNYTSQWVIIRKMFVCFSCRL